MLFILGFVSFLFWEVFIPCVSNFQWAISENLHIWLFLLSLVWLLHTANTMFCHFCMQHASVQERSVDWQSFCLILLFNSKWVRQRVVPSSDCRVLLQCCSRSPGSVVGKKTAAGRPVPAESSLNPTAVSRACQPGTPPTLFSTLCWDVYMEFLWPFWMRWRDFSTWGSHRNTDDLFVQNHTKSHTPTTISIFLNENETYEKKNTKWKTNIKIIKLLNINVI